MFEKLKEYGNNNEEVTSPIVKEAVNEYQEIISLLLKSGADPTLQVYWLYPAFRIASALIVIVTISGQCWSYCC